MQQLFLIIILKIVAGGGGGGLKIAGYIKNGSFAFIELLLLLSSRDAVC